MRTWIIVTALAAAGAGAATAEPSTSPRPIGSLGAGGDLQVAGTQGAPRGRVAAEAIAYVTRKYGVYASARRVLVDPAFDEGQVTVGVALRAAAARPLLELVVHADAGVAWPDVDPVVGGGVTTFLWPLKKVPVAVTTGLGAYVVLDGVDDTRLVLGLNLGLAIAR